MFEDNCEALAATYNGRSAGGFGSLSTLSFYYSHHISTMEGGAITTNSGRYQKMLLSLRSHGWTRDLSTRNARSCARGPDFNDLFNFILPGYNVRPLEISAAIGLRQLGKLDKLIAGRRRNAEVFKSVMEDVQTARGQIELGRSSWFGFSVILQERLAGRRAEVVRALNSAGVETRPIAAGNFGRQPVASRLDLAIPDKLEAADEVHDNGFYVGNSHMPLTAGICRLAEVLCAL